VISIFPQPRAVSGPRAGRSALLQLRLPIANHMKVGEKMILNECGISHTVSSFDAGIAFQQVFANGKKTRGSGEYAPGSDRQTMCR
jgi:hypothetical protein